MSIIFPSLKPSQRNFKLGTFPTKVYRSLSGATVKRSFGSKPFGYELQVVFSNIDDATTALILEHYGDTFGGFTRFQLPDTLFSGMSDALRDYAKASATIRWEYAGVPEVESVIGGRSTVQVTFIGEQNV